MLKKHLFNLSFLLIIPFITLLFTHDYYYFSFSDTLVKTKKDVDNNYLGTIKIPKINLERSFYQINSKENNVKENIQVLKFDNTIILAAHSGNNYNAYFKKLKKLVQNDLVNIYYKDIKYTYKVTNIYQVNKKGYIDFNNNYLNNTLILITCNEKDKTKQIVIICVRLD